MPLKAFLRRPSPSPTVTGVPLGARPPKSSTPTAPQLKKAAKQLFALVRRTAGKPEPAAGTSDATTATLGAKDPEGTLSDAPVAASTAPLPPALALIELNPSSQCGNQPESTSLQASAGIVPAPHEQAQGLATSTSEASPKLNAKSSVASVASQPSSKETESHSGASLRAPPPPATYKHRGFSGPEWRIIGQGGFGTVYCRTDPHSKRETAIKAISKHSLYEAANNGFPMWDSLILEWRYMRILQRGRAKQWVPHLYGVGPSKHSFNFVMDYYSNGSLYHHQKQISESWEALNYYIVQLTVGLEQIHDAGFTHRDLKPENILVNWDGHIIFSDFGLSDKKTQGLQGRCGTSGFIAPEVLTNTSATYYSHKCDWWSLGVTIYWLIFGKMPFPDVKAAAASNYELPSNIDEIWNDDLRDYVCNLLKPKVSERVTPRSHQYMKKMIPNYATYLAIAEKRTQSPIVLSPPPAFIVSEKSSEHTMTPSEVSFVDWQLDAVMGGKTSVIPSKW